MYLYNINASFRTNTEQVKHFRFTITIVHRTLTSANSHPQPQLSRAQLDRYSLDLGITIV
jgi:hypothetical protein